MDHHGDSTISDNILVNLRPPSCSGDSARRLFSLAASQGIDRHAHVHRSRVRETAMSDEETRVHECASRPNGPTPE
eukprot:CAMPEP_0185561602 /NCGR_PEP_ID=MMETSP1381-20130426/59564_1 /TAXON_ID=298111 /ORGANISM="Pavlova sp., Strain CCMP459" /LENGTH=75 /DNA_ID=CAMNT_0028175387 /DNA_START=228 /DNA_END=455 /DNA_ORIENTATION=-